MYPPDFESRLVAAKENKNIDELNCHAATFYLLGLNDSEIPVDAFKNRLIERYFDIILRSQTFQGDIPKDAEGFAICHQRVDRGQSVYWHSGVIHPQDRTKVIHRFDYGYPIMIALASSAINLAYYNRFTGFPSYMEVQFLKKK